MGKDILGKIPVMTMNNVVGTRFTQTVCEPGKTDRFKPSGERDDRHFMESNAASVGLPPGGKHMGFATMSGGKTFRHFKYKLFSSAHLTVVGTENGNTHRG